MSFLQTALINDSASLVTELCSRVTCAVIRIMIWSSRFGRSGRRWVASLLDASETSGRKVPQLHRIRVPCPNGWCWSNLMTVTNFALYFTSWSKFEQNKFQLRNPFTESHRRSREVYGTKFKTTFREYCLCQSNFVTEKKGCQCWIQQMQNHTQTKG